MNEKALFGVLFSWEALRTARRYIRRAEEIRAAIKLQSKEKQSV